MVVIYCDYSRARIGYFFGLSGWQLAVVAAVPDAGVRVRQRRRVAARGRCSP